MALKGAAVTNRMQARLLQGLMVVWAGMGCWAGTLAVAQTRSAARAQTVEALLLSDIHLDPFRDPDKAVRLATAPVAEWQRILAAPDSADRTERFAAVEQACPTRGEDTGFRLMESSYQAMHVRAAGVRFAVVGGDLMGHAFPCRFAAVFPKAGPEDYRAFVDKTIAFVVGSLREALPGVPVYAALGNNDTDCEDYRIDAGSRFLHESGKTMTADVDSAERGEALRTFAEGGYYSTTIPAVAHARLLVIDDLFLSRRYATCGGKMDAAAGEGQIAWLGKQLAEARSRKEKVWVVAHIPPGVDPYATAMKGFKLCGGGKAEMFLSTGALQETLTAYGDVIQLVLFGHTHMDEMRVLEAEKNGPAGKAVAAKVVASISPINGNKPSFAVAHVDAATAALVDYDVIAASNATGIDAAWTEEYDFAKAYKETGYSAAAVESLIAGFKADPGAKAGASQSYIRSYGTGMGARTLSLFWPLYVCSLKSEAAEAFNACVCGAVQ
jgi:sphingomyelin phosphodiesterase acid-like 3